MPVFVYQCDSCGIVKELLIRQKNEEKQVCEICKKPMRRVFSTCFFKFIGSGFYENDHKNVVDLNK